MNRKNIAYKSTLKTKENKEHQISSIKLELSRINSKILKIKRQKK